MAVFDAQGQQVGDAFTNFFNPQTGFATDPTQFAQGFQNINPYSGQAAGNLFGQNANNFITQGLGAQPTSFDPNAAFNQFMGQNGQANQLMGLVQGSMSPLEQSLNERANQLSGQAVENVASRFAGSNALFGGGAQEAISQAAAQPFADVANQLGQQQIGLFGNLAGQQLGLGNQANQFGASLAEQGRQANQAGALGLLGQQAQFGDQMFVQPDMVTEASGFNQAVSPLLNTLLGGIGGGLGGALGAGAPGFFSGMGDGIAQFGQSLFNPQVGAPNYSTYSPTASVNPYTTSNLNSTSGGLRAR